MMGTRLPETCREVKKILTKQNCAPSWIYLQDCTRMHGQKNIKYWSESFAFCEWGNIFRLNEY